MTISTWINGEGVTVDVDETWFEIFALWNELVDTDTAVAIADTYVAFLATAIDTPDTAYDYDGYLAPLTAYDYDTD